MKKILLIEDDPFVGRMYKRVFTLSGFEAIWEWNGTDGLKAAEKSKPDLILLDIMMPVMNGIQVLEKLKQMTATHDIPVVILTNLTMPEEIEMALSKGAEKYLIKSDYQPRQVVELVKELLSSK